MNGQQLYETIEKIVNIAVNNSIHIKAIELRKKDYKKFSMYVDELSRVVPLHWYTLPYTSIDFFMRGVPVREEQ